MLKQSRKIFDDKNWRAYSLRILMSTIWGFYHIKKKHNFCRGKGCMKKCCKYLREHAQKNNCFCKKKVLPLTSKELKLHEDAKACCICEKYFIEKLLQNINYGKVRDYTIIQVNTEARRTVFVI